MLRMTAWKLFPPKLTDVNISTRQLGLFTFFVDDHGIVEYYLVRTEKSRFQSCIPKLNLKVMLQLLVGVIMIFQ